MLRAILLATACAMLPPGGPASALPSCGEASWYDHEGRPTASGGTHDPDALTAAHRSLPFGSKVNVENLQNGKSVTVKINDRGPFTQGRIIDVSRAAAEELAFKGAGVTRVRISTAGQTGEAPAKTCR